MDIVKFAELVIDSQKLTDVIRANGGSFASTSEVEKLWTSIGGRKGEFGRVLHMAAALGLVTIAQRGKRRTIAVAEV